MPLVSAGGIPAWEPARFPGPKWVGQMPSAPLPLLQSWRAPPTCLSCSPLAFLVCPRTSVAWRGPWKAGNPDWKLSRFSGPKWEGQTPSAPLLLLRSWRAPPACLSCSPPASLLCPQDQRVPEGASEGVGAAPRAGQTSWADWAGETLGSLPPRSEPLRVPPGMGTPPRLSHPSGAPALSSLHFSSSLSSPISYWFAWGVPPISLGIKVPHQHPAGTQVVGRRELHVFPLCHLLKFYLLLVSLYFNTRMWLGDALSDSAVPDLCVIFIYSYIYVLA